MDEPVKTSDFLPVADVEVSAVRPQRTGFSLQGIGADRAEYRVELELEVPVDQRTRSVLGEILSQSRWRILRRAPQPMRTPSRPLRSPLAAKTSGEAKRQSPKPAGDT